MPEDAHERLKDEEGIQNGKPATCRPAQTPRGEPSRGRGITWQLYGLAASGCRERLEVWQFYGPVVSAAPNRRDCKTLRWVIPGSRLLLTHRAAIL